MMHKSYQLGWIAFWLGNFGLEFVFGLDPVWGQYNVWLFSFLFFVVLEMVAIFRKKEGDTLSEFVAFVLLPHDRAWARWFLITGLSAWICWRYLFILPDPDVGRCLLAAGFFLWLVPHWCGRLKHG